jgi:hypothetical protein
MPSSLPYPQFYLPPSSLPGTVLPFAVMVPLQKFTIPCLIHSYVCVPVRVSVRVSVNFLTALRIFMSETTISCGFRTRRRGNLKSLSRERGWQHQLKISAPLPLRETYQLKPLLPANPFR